MSIPSGEGIADLLDVLGEAVDQARAESMSTGVPYPLIVARWARLGRALEDSSSFDRDRVLQAWKCEISAEQLTEVETEVFLDGLAEAMEKYETLTSKAFYAEMKRKGGVGVDEAGRLVRRHPDGRIEVLREVA